MITNIKDIKTLLKYDEYTIAAYINDIRIKKRELGKEGIHLKNKDKTVDYYLTLIVLHYFICAYNETLTLKIYPRTTIRYNLIDNENVKYILDEGSKYCKDTFITLCKKLKSNHNVYYEDITKYFTKLNYYNLCIYKLNSIYGKWHDENNIYHIPNNFRATMLIGDKISFVIGLHWLLCTNHKAPICITRSNNKNYEVCLNTVDCAENVLNYIWDDDNIVITSKEMYRDLCNVLKYINSQFVKIEYKPFLLPYKYDIDNVKSESTISIFKDKQIKFLF